LPPVGRPPAERNVYSFEGRLVPPAELVLDTSFVADALIPSQARHPQCREFLTIMALGNCRVIYNRFLEAELWETAYRIALKELHPKKRANEVRHDGRTIKRARTLRDEVDRAWEEVLSTLDSVVVELTEVSHWLPLLMGCGLSSYDAIHAATARYAGVQPFVTLDSHFARVPERTLQLWVPSDRVSVCRQRRA
jgi:predicted nucleic acid-binding protein